VKISRKKFNLPFYQFSKSAFCAEIDFYVISAKVLSIDQKKYPVLFAVIFYITAKITGWK